MSELLIKKGHGKTDVSCYHGSRWVWWYAKGYTNPLGEWMNVVFASNCDCGDPPLPFTNKGQVKAYLDKKAGKIKELPT
jgi:hypothetical protein